MLLAFDIIPKNGTTEFVTLASSQRAEATWDVHVVWEGKTMHNSTLYANNFDQDLHRSGNWMVNFTLHWFTKTHPPSVHRRCSAQNCCVTQIPNLHQIIWMCIKTYECVVHNAMQEQRHQWLLHIQSIGGREPPMLLQLWCSTVQCSLAQSSPVENSLV